jgi:DNA-directed RNA polymerase sigma subunit (sigma70/sigma32)
MSKPNLQEEMAHYMGTKMKFGEREMDIFNSRINSPVYLMTLQGLADKWGASRERIRQIQERIIDKLDNIN